jgi:hypothetical protein
MDAQVYLYEVFVICVKQRKGDFCRFYNVKVRSEGFDVH